MSIDKTRDNIRATELDEQTRKELFGKFVDAGGEVIRDREAKRKGLSIDRDKQRALISQQEQKRNQRRQEWDELQRKKGSPKSASRSKIQGTGFLDRMKINIFCWLKGACNFGGEYIQPKFAANIIGEFKNAISGLNLLYLELLQGNPKFTESLTRHLDQINPIFIELLEKAGEIYDKHEFNNIEETINRYGKNPIPLKQIGQDLTQIFRRIFILYFHSGQLVRAMESALRKMNELDPDRISIYNKRKKKAGQDIQIIYIKYFPALYWVFLRSKKRFIPLTREDLASALEIALDMFPGKRTVTENENPDEKNQDPAQNDKSPENENKESSSNNEETDDSAKNDQQEQQDQEDEKNKKIAIEKLPKAQQIGLEIMRKLSIKRLIDKYGTKEKHSTLQPRDKVFLSYLLFREFDEEYSFVLTTNKIKFNYDFSEGKKTDYKVELNDLFQMSHDVYDNFDNYVDLTKELAEHKSNKPSQATYIQHSKRATEIEGKIHAAARTTRNTIKDMMEKTAEKLEPLIKDCRSEQKFIGNGQDKLKFDINIEGKKKLNNQTVCNALQYTYVYCRAFAFRLSDNGGDLYGGVLELENKDSFFPPDPASSPKQNNSPQNDQPEKTNSELNNVTIENNDNNDDSINNQNSNMENDKSKTAHKQTGTITDDLDNLGF